MVKSNPVCLIDEELHAILDLFYCGQAGESASLAAAANGHSDTLCLLLDRGANVNDVDSVRDNCHSLCIASCNLLILALVLITIEDLLDKGIHVDMCRSIR